MDAQRWRAEQRNLREALGSQRRTPARSAGGAPIEIAVPPVSVIVVCWNSADVLGRCLRQLLEQDYGGEHEIVVVDDGSTDHTRQVAERELGGSGGRGRIVGGPVNRGISHARNLGLRHARGEIVAFVDADGFAAPSWLREVVGAFGADQAIGGVASTVFFADNPLVINGAGGIVNRQGWAADLAMNESYEWAELAAEALYPMGCGMALRRAAVERVGGFDERMVNYYDDVDYGVRLWRAGYRVVVAESAWIDHGFGQSGGESARKRLLCERHRMRVVLKHARARACLTWAVHEARALKQADAERRRLKGRAMAWNARHLPSLLRARRRVNGAPTVPERLVDSSWGDGFPAGVPPRRTPRPESTGNVLDMATAGSEGQLLYGWFTAERVAGRSYRWAGVQAGALIRLDAPARRLRLRFAHVPVDGGGIGMQIRRLGASEPLVPVWSGHLAWQYIERSVENHPLELEAGDYEVLFSSPCGWTDPPRETRLLGFALASMAFEETYDVASGGLNMAAPTVEQQLLSGWFEAERSGGGDAEDNVARSAGGSVVVEYGGGRSYRWASGHAAVIVRLAQSARGARLSYRFPPGPTGALSVSVRPVGARAAVWSTRIAWREGEWREEALELRLAAGDYVVAFHTEDTWSNPGQRERELPPENRALGFALESLLFDLA
jgi:GT2 family glycosyltransferase